MMTRIKSLHDPKLQQFIDSMYEFLSEYEDLQDEQRSLSYQITNLKSKGEDPEYISEEEEELESLDENMKFIEWDMKRLITDYNKKISN